MKKILVTGASGQLGRCLQDIVSQFSNLYVIFVSKEELDVTDDSEVKQFFKNNSFKYCINTAAYTNVEKAEEDFEEAFKINAGAVKILAENCRKNNVTLLQISTDYVFEGKKTTPYLETDAVNPLNVYGASKLQGEKYVDEVCPRHFIIRTSWLYSEYGHNFLNTIKRFVQEDKSLKITTEQTGTPTNANDLAKLLLDIIDTGNKEYGLYHFSNQGEATWYDFAEEIVKNLAPDKTDLIEKIDHYPTKAARPEYSVLDCGKIENKLSMNIIEWKKSLKSII